MTVLSYDPAGAYSIKVLRRGDRLHQVSNVIMTLVTAAHLDGLPIFVLKKGERYWLVRFLGDFELN